MCVKIVRKGHFKGEGGYIVSSAKFFVGGGGMGAGKEEGEI